jgi:hypothetical protein
MLCIGLTGVMAMVTAPQAGAKAPTLQDAIGNPDDFTLTGTLRVRYEALDGQFRPGFDARDDLVSIRTTLLAEYRNSGFRVGAEFWDSRAYDTDPGSVLSTGEVNSFEFVQAYIGYQVDGSLGPGSKLSLQAGRFTMNLGSRRLVAADDYRNTTNGYTGIRADAKLKDGTSATLFYTLPQFRRPDGLDDLRNNRQAFDHESFNLQLWGGFVSRPKLFGRAMAEASYVRLQERDAPARPTRNRNLHSVGLRLITDPASGKIDYEAEGIFQLGSVRSGLSTTASLLDVSAYFFHLEAGYSWSGSWKPHISMEYDVASGDHPGGGYGRFDTLFGMRRADLGPAGIYAALGRTNIEALGPRLELTPSRRTDAFLTVKALWAQSATDSFSTTGVRDPSGVSGRLAGYQLDGRVRHWLVPQALRAEINGAWLIKRGLLNDAPNAPRTGDTRYISTALIATF